MVKLSDLKTELLEGEPHFVVQAKSERTAVVYANGLPDSEPHFWALYAFISGAAMSKTSLRAKARFDLDEGPYLEARGWHELGRLMAPESIARNWAAQIEWSRRPGVLEQEMVDKWLDDFEAYDPEIEGRLQFLQRFADLVSNIETLTGQASVNVSVLANRLHVTRVTIRRWMGEIERRGIQGVPDASLGQRTVITSAIYKEQN